MFTSPTVVTINTVDHDFTRQNQDDGNSRWFNQPADTLSEQLMRIRHSEHKANSSYGATFRRHNVELTRLIYPTATEVQRFRKQYITFERELGDVDLHDLKALCNWVLTGTNADLLLQSMP